MRIIFAGTPDFAASALAALLANNAEIVAVLTQPDRPAGRGMLLTPGPVKKLAIQHGIPVLQPLTLKAAEVQLRLEALHADVMVVAAYGLILPLAILQMPLHGCLNIHASLLPRWRGAAPVQRAILAGDTETGITIMQMDEGLDTGDMLLKKSCPISGQDTARSLHDKLARLGAEAITEALGMLERGHLHKQAQDATRATYAAKIIKAEANLNWAQSADYLERAIRAYNPVPGAYSSLNGMSVKIWQANKAEGQQGEPGTVLMVDKNHIRVACGQGALNLEILQRPGGKPLPVSQFLQGVVVKVGDWFATL